MEEPGEVMRGGLRTDVDLAAARDIVEDAFDDVGVLMLEPLSEDMSKGRGSDSGGENQ